MKQEEFCPLRPGRCPGPGCAFWLDGCLVRRALAPRPSLFSFTRKSLAPLVRLLTFPSAGPAREIETLNREEAK